MTERVRQDSSRGQRAADEGRSGGDPSDFEVVVTGGPARSVLTDSWPEVHQASGMVAVQLDSSIADAASALEAEADSEGRSVESVAEDVVARRLTFPIRDTDTGCGDHAGQVEAWYSENHHNEALLVDHERIDADRWLYLHRDEVIGTSQAAATALIQESGMSADVLQGTEPDLPPHLWDTGRIRLLVDESGRVQTAEWG